MHKRSVYGAKGEKKMTKDEAEGLLKTQVKNERMLDHSYASEAVLRALARRLGRDEAKWGLAGLLHDIDIEVVGGDLARHGIEAERILAQKGIDPEIVDAVKMHNEAVCGIKRSTEFQHALAAGETITGFIVATTLVYPDKKIASVKVKSITKRMKEKAFAASVNRETIRECEQLGLSLDEFVEISLGAMREIAGRLGL
jgi:putative nucleotidyltransferase with HDIG domain